MRAFVCICVSVRAFVCICVSVRACVCVCVCVCASGFCCCINQEEVLKRPKWIYVSDLVGCLIVTK